MEDLIKAMTIFFKYTQAHNPTHCEHDVMWVNVDYDIVSDKDKAILSELGFDRETDNSTFQSYRFGSC